MERTGDLSLFERSQNLVYLGVEAFILSVGIIYIPLGRGKKIILVGNVTEGPRGVARAKGRQPHVDAYGPCQPIWRLFVVALGKIFGRA